MDFFDSDFGFFCLLCLGFGLAFLILGGVSWIFTWLITHGY